MPLPEFTDVVPVSFILTDESAGDGPHVFIELRNGIGGAMLVQLLEVHLLQGSLSFDALSVPASRHWIEADGSAHYHAMDVYGKSVGNADWDGLEMIVGAPVVK